MSKKLIAGLLAVLLILVLAGSAVSAREIDSTLEELYEQMYELRRQVIERKGELGILSDEEKNDRLTFMEERFNEWREEGSGWFFGMHGRRWGGAWQEDGAPRGYGHCWR